MKNLTTFLQIDLQDIFFEARERKEKLDFEKIWEYFNSRETEYLIGAYLYLIKKPFFDITKFEKKLESIGYTIKAKQFVNPQFKKSIYLESKNKKLKPDNKSPIHFQLIPRQTNHDVGITVDCIDKIRTYDKWIIMSVEGDIKALCQYLKQKNKLVEIWNFKENHNSSLEPFTDRFNFIDEKFFYKKPKVQVFGFQWGPE